ncbi:MAG: chitobiase/beta-hexosaminidase C-terminal domain-containing protein [Candidatus Eisenbacteria bacterium]|uniref:Chitobiase/beta-hexosaminidase C-terminal domain-containing protein n=1 Tax=Eiseniibacteriota bacterium TaxID=2212470 RepID=A0A937XBA0_UNCEI|nr:chitobiase/beta-hexosaminidase C-terminal domain-containing protein [Candidatus Eisenbacteria bacterium]
MRAASIASGGFLLLALLLIGIPRPAEGTPPDPGVFDRPKLHTVATAHLDTQWRWTIRETIEEYIPATLRGNFALFDSFPHYTFSFEGAFRYMLIKEYYPAEYARLKAHVAAGRWRVAGSWVDAVDTNIPSPESLVRQTLYGNGYFWRELGVTSRDVFLPDCFGFGFALPSVAAHCGLTGFSTQKLGWGSAVGVPFDIGLWEGVDGSRLVAALNPGSYVSAIEGDLSADSLWLARARAQGELSGTPVAMRYFGVGDQGGAPGASSVDRLVRAIEGSGPLTVRSAASDQLARDLTAGLRDDLAAGLRPEIFRDRAAEPAVARLARLPLYRGEMLMTDHGAGCYTSQAAMKRWNRKNEQLADASERACVAAAWLGGLPYPREALRAAWVRFLWHQFHDDLTGTSIPEAYVYSWNDELLSLNEFAGLLGSGAGAVARALDTNVQGTPIVVFNPLSIRRRDIVQAAIELPGPVPAALRVHGPDGGETPAQILRASGRTAEILFQAELPSLGWAVYDVREAAAGADAAAEAPGATATGLMVSERGLENERYRVTLDFSGDIASILDKRSGRELLAGPLTLQLLEDEPAEWAAWEIDYDDLMAAPREVVGGPAWVRAIESGPVRVGLQVVRERAGSRFVQDIRLGAGDAGDMVTVELDLDWRTPATLLKAAFPLAVAGGAAEPAAPRATYDLGLGVIERGVNSPTLYEVPAQQWAELTAPGGDHGVAVLSDCRYGWDRPDAGTLRLSLVRTPRVNPGWRWVADQETQDLGRHRLTYALAGHSGDWRDGVVQLGERLNQPLIAFQAEKHAGSLGRSFSFARIAAAGNGGESAVAIRALKLAEETDEIVVRVQELHGRRQEQVRLAFARPVLQARELNGAEEPLAESAPVEEGVLAFHLAPFQLRTFAVRLAGPALRLSPPRALPLDLPYNVDGISRDDDRRDGDFDGRGRTLAGELLPAVLACGGIPFHTGSQAPGQRNVLACAGQRLALPAGDYDRLYLLAAAVDGDRPATFLIEAPGGDTLGVEQWIQDYAEPIGQWDNRLVAGGLVEDPAAITPAYIKRQPVGWVGTHRHSAAGTNEAYAFTYAFLHTLELPAGARAVVLPQDPGVRILAATIAHNPNDQARPAGALHDDAPLTVVRISAPLGAFVDSLAVSLSSPTPRATIHYTLDGSEPTPASALYKAPLRLTETTRVRARAYAEGYDPAHVAEASFARMTPRPATAAADLRPGLACRLYAGAWDRLPAFDQLASGTAAVLEEIGLPAGAPEVDFGLRGDGFLVVPRDGVYEFRLVSDDGSALWIDGRMLIDNDGLHGKQEVRGTTALQAGAHPLRLEFFQRGGDRVLELWVEGDGVPLQRVPGAWLWHRAPGEGGP